MIFFLNLTTASILIIFWNNLIIIKLTEAILINLSPWGKKHPKINQPHLKSHLKSYREKTNILWCTLMKICHPGSLSHWRKGWKCFCLDLVKSLMSNSCQKLFEILNTMADSFFESKNIFDYLTIDKFLIK